MQEDSLGVLHARIHGLQALAEELDRQLQFHSGLLEQTKGQIHRIEKEKDLIRRQIAQLNETLARKFEQQHPANRR